MGFGSWFKELKETRISMNVFHISGLPLPANGKCRLYVFYNKIRFKDESTTIELEISRITNVELRQFTKQELITESSTLKAAAGYALFGIAGAVIGAMPEEKNKNVKYSYLVIQYTKDNNDAYIVLDATNSVDWAKCFVKVLGFSEKPKQTIKL